MAQSITTDFMIKNYNDTSLHGMIICDQFYN
jgi:hypothetical protein